MKTRSGSGMDENWDENEEYAEKPLVPDADGKEQVIAPQESEKSDPLTDGLDDDPIDEPGEDNPGGDDNPGENDDPHEDEPEDNEQADIDSIQDVNILHAWNHQDESHMLYEYSCPAKTRYLHHYQCT